MPIPVVCPHCNGKFRAPDGSAGRRVKCKGCQNAFVVPSLTNEIDSLATVVPIEQTTDLEIIEQHVPKGRLVKDGENYIPVSIHTKIAVGAGIGALVMFTCCGGVIFMSIFKPPEREGRDVFARHDDNQARPGKNVVDERREPDPDIRTTPEAMLFAYERNSIAADKQYKGKLIEVSGTIGTINTDILGTAYITFERPGQFEIRTVQCYFSKSKLGDLAELHKGERVTVVGRCDGQVINVLLKDCSIR